jgi:hypothetical protein
MHSRPDGDSADACRWRGVEAVLDCDGKAWGLALAAVIVEEEGEGFSIRELAVAWIGRELGLRTVK